MELPVKYQCACAECGHVIDFLSADAGKIVKCPNCGEESRLPEPNKLIMIEMFGPPVPEFRNCEVCGTQVKFFDETCPVCERKRRKKILQLRIAIAASVAVVLLIAALVYHHIQKVRAQQAATHPPHIYMEQPRPYLPKSTNNLQPGKFVLEKRRGNDLLVAAGDIQNISQNVHTRVRADFSVLDKTGTKIGTVSDYCADLGAYQTWHVIATVTQPNAASVKFAGISEDP